MLRRGEMSQRFGKAALRRTLECCGRVYGFEPSLVDAIVDQSHVFSATRRTPICGHRDRDEGVYFVVEGVVTIEATLADERVAAVELLPPGRFFCVPELPASWPLRRVAAVPRTSALIAVISLPVVRTLLGRMSTDGVLHLMLAMLGPLALSVIRKTVVMASSLEGRLRIEGAELDRRLDPGCEHLGAGVEPVTHVEIARHVASGRTAVCKAMRKARLARPGSGGGRG